MTDFSSAGESRSGEVERSSAIAARACVVLGLAALTAAIAARVVAPDALYDRWLILAAVGAGLAAGTFSGRSRGVVSRSGTISALALLAVYSLAVVFIPPSHDGLKAILAKARFFDEKLVYVEGGNGVATLWPENGDWSLTSPADPSAFEATRRNLRLRIERIDGVSEGIELGDYADLALSDFVDRGELLASDWEGTGDYGNRPTAWRAFAAFDDEKDETPTYGVLVVYAEGDSVYGARLDAPTPEEHYESGPAARDVLATATADPAKKFDLRKRVGWVSPPVASSSAPETPGRPPIASPGAAGQNRVSSNAKPYRPRRGGRAGALQDLSEMLRGYNESAR